MNKNVTLPLEAATRLGGRRPDRRELGERPIVRIHLLGPMRATTYLGENVLPHGKRARAVLGYLCLAAGEHVPRAELAALLWDRVSAAAARTNLRQVLHELSSTFGGFPGTHHQRPRRYPLQRRSLLDRCARRAHARSRDGRRAARRLAGSVPRRTAR